MFDEKLLDWRTDPEVNQLEADLKKTKHLFAESVEKADRAKANRDSAIHAHESLEIDEIAGICSGDQVSKAKTHREESEASWKQAEATRRKYEKQTEQVAEALERVKSKVQSETRARIRKESADAIRAMIQAGETFQAANQRVKDLISLSSSQFSWLSGSGPGLKAVQMNEMVGPRFKHWKISAENFLQELEK